MTHTQDLPDVAQALGVTPEQWNALSPEDQAEATRELAELAQVYEDNPLSRFVPHSAQQATFLSAKTPIVAAFAGNRFGKTTSLVVRAIIEVVDRDYLTPELAQFKNFDAPAHAWILCPTEDKLYDSLQPAFEKWMPKRMWKGGAWGKSFNGQRMMLTLSNGSTIAFKTYKQDPSTLGGADLHFIGYDEPPPRAHRDECLTRLAGHDAAYEMYAMTPLKTNTGWIRRDIYKKRESPDITVIRGAMHDNPTLSEKMKQFILSQYQSDIWRRAREFGDFVEVGGLIYAGFEQAVVPRFERGFISGLDHVVGIDPGIRNAAFVWVGFDDENRAFVFDEVLLQDKTPADYAEAIKAKNREWGVQHPLYVIDPAARSRSQVNAESVETALIQLGIPTTPGQNQVEAGIQQVRQRIQHQRIRVGANCAGLRDEADEYAAEDREDGEFKPVKENDHRLDALRYALMARSWDPLVEDKSAREALGRQLVDGFAPAWTGEPPMGPRSDLPMGSMS